MGNLLITSPFKKHGVVEGFLRDLDGLGHDIVLYNYGESPERDFTEFDGFTEYHSPVSEVGNNNFFLGQTEAYHRDELVDIMERHGTDLVIPTSEKFLSLVASNPHIFGNKSYVPSQAVLDLNFDKMKTYDFYNQHGIPVPHVVSIDAKHPQGLEDFIKEHGSVFMKPVMSSGGQKAVQIRTMDDFYREYSPEDGDLVASEVLNLPEYTHTVLVEDGHVRRGATYVGPGSIGFSLTGYLERTAVDVPEVAQLGERVIDVLRGEFGSEQINGAYNMDFLTRDSGAYVLSEVNPGRLPGSHSTITMSGYNIAADYVNTGLRSAYKITA